ncbi:SDR family oxidoreductase [Micromonospora purpureochromogenes]|uniref:SDR family NAD(P)-dependent oxidoreductase n=1 Tax=Micromonospora purpureochromogenes TaxID=47872 RepID=UPI0033203E6F
MREAARKADTQRTTPNGAVVRDARCTPRRRRRSGTSSDSTCARPWSARRRRYAGSSPPAPEARSSTPRPTRPAGRCRAACRTATAKAAVEGLTRALAVEYGPRGVRTNAVALGSIHTERHAAFLAEREPAEVEWIEAELARLHPVGRTGRVEEVAEAVAYLLSAAFVNGVTLPVDGGRAVLGLDPEAR